MVGFSNYDCFGKVLTSLAFLATTPPRYRHHHHHQPNKQDSIVSLSGTPQLDGDPSTTTGSRNINSRRLHDADGKCIFGLKSYWDDFYEKSGGEDGTTAEFSVASSTSTTSSSSYSWYCGWNELEPFWSMLVPNKQTARVLIAGIGNDPTPVAMYHAGWHYNMTAFDYSQPAVERAQALFGNQDCRPLVQFLVADARNLPLPSASIDATLDKGTLDAIYITGRDAFQEAVQELTRVTANGGVVVCLSRVLEPSDLLSAFTGCWENIHDGSLAFAENGEATIDLGANLYSWRRRTS